MSIMRRVLLAGAENTWLRERAMRTAVRSALGLAVHAGRDDGGCARGGRRQLAEQGIGTILTHLGENLSTLAEAEAVTAHYLDLLERVDRDRLNAEVSVKLTQLGLDLGSEECYRNLAALVERAGAARQHGVDRHGKHAYVDPTLDDLPAPPRAFTPHVGRLPAGLPAAHRLGSRGAAPARRRHPAGEGRLPRVAGGGLPATRRTWTRTTTGWPAASSTRRRRPGRSSASAPTTSVWSADRLRAVAARRRRPERYEFEMLYGIQRPLQARLVRDGLPLRVLISYGEFWFPWYMRRLAERPANVLFVARSLFAR